MLLKLGPTIQDFWQIAFSCDLVLTFLHDLMHLKLQNFVIRTIICGILTLSFQIRFDKIHILGLQITKKRDFCNPFSLRHIQQQFATFISLGFDQFCL